MRKSKLFIGLLVVILLGGAVFFWKRSRTVNIKSLESGASAQNGEQLSGSEEQKMSDQSGDSGDAGAQDVDYNAICQNGDWVKIADVSGELATASGKLRRVYPGSRGSSDFKNYLYYIEGSPSFGLTGNDLSKLDPFEDREVEIQGLESGDGKEIAVSQVRCSGAETDKNLIDARAKILDYISANIATLAPQKAKYKQWAVDTVSFVDNNDVYVEYYDSAEDADNWQGEDTSRKILAQISSGSSNGFGANVLAYWEMGADDYVLKTGSDKSGGATDAISYQYDPEKHTWDRIN